MCAPRVTRHTSIRYSAVNGRPLYFCLHRHTVSVNSLYHARMVLSIGGSFAYFARNARWTVTTDWLVWYSNTQNDFSHGAAIFSLHTRSDQKVPRLIFLLCCGYTLGHPCLQGGVLELPLSLGQWLVPAHLSVLCELQSKRVVYLRLVIVPAVRDVRRTRAAHVRQILCETGKKWCGDIWNVENCLRWAVFEPCSHFRMAQEIWRRPRLSWWQSAVWQRDDKQNWRLCCANARTDPSKSALNNPWTLCRGWSVLRNLPGHIEARFEHATCCRKFVPRILTAMALVCGNKYAAGRRVRWKLYGANHHGRRDVGLRVWPGDETSVFAVEVCWFPEAKKARQVRSKVKVMLIVFFDMEGIVHYKNVSQGQTVNQQFYLQVLKRLRLSVSRKRPQKLAAGPGRYITTMHQHTQHIPSRYFWQVMAFLLSSNHPTSLTWLRVTFGCFSN